MTGQAASPTHESTDAVMARVLDDRPDVVAALAVAHTAAWAAVDPVLLEVCRLRVAMLLGCDDELAMRTPAALDAGLEENVVVELASWPTSSRFDARARACLALTEQFVIDVATLDETLTDDVTSHLGAAGLVDFTHALLVVEQRMRLRLVWQRLLEPAEVGS